MLWALVCVVGAWGCNAFTGASDYEIADVDDNRNEGIDETEGSSASSGESSSSSGGQQTGSSSSGGPIENGPLAPADGVQITSIALYQGVKRPLMQGGAATSSTVPIVANRPAMLRVFYAVDGAYDGQPVTARLTLGDQTPLEATGVLGGSSTDGNLGSTVNVAIAAEALAGSTSYRVELLQPQSSSSGNNLAAVYPAQGQESLQVQSSGSQLRIVLVPISYSADGSNRLPDTSATQVKRYQELFFKTYPTPKVVVSVHPAYKWGSTISPYGQGWNELLNAMISYRQQSGAAADEYYYGIFAPASSMSAFCGGGCVAGLSLLAGANDPMGRVGIGVGFSGAGSVETAVHEVGHQHGRGHAPCGANQGIDPSFPYSNGGISAWGYDLLTGSLVSPSNHKDFMSYCNPTWVSDYNFGKLFSRMKLVNGADFQYPGAEIPKQYARVDLSGDSEQASWLSPITLSRPPLADAQQVELKTVSGTITVSGHYYPYSHLSGGVLLFTQPANIELGLVLSVDGRKIVSSSN